MLKDEVNIILSDRVYQLDSSRKDFDDQLKPNANLKLQNRTAELGNFKILKVEDNQENGMQAMAVAPIGADGQPDYSQIIITYAGTNAGDHRDRQTDIQMIIQGRMDRLARSEPGGEIEAVESQAVTALRFAEEVRKQ